MVMHRTFNPGNGDRYLAGAPTYRYMNKDNTYELTFSAGRLLCGTIREWLEDAHFRGANVRWRESSGFWSRNWHVIGDKYVLEELTNILNTNNNIPNGFGI